MAADGANIAEDAEMAECDGDKVVTMMDVLQEQQDFEEDANAVLGASDDKNCTYSKGYIKRQALYACLTCCTEAKTDPTKRAGVCLACSLTCHENHELIELYTKRNFKCDCGNPKFNSHPCQFTPDKTDLNDDNIYNQNFSGLYCICQRPYPDPESTIEDDMIQCIICEDWLHASHLEAVVPANDQYSEMVCKGCMEKNEFLHDYTLYAVTAETGDVDIVNVNGDTKSSDNSLCNGDLEKDKLVNGIKENNTVKQIEAVNEDVEMEENKVIDGSEKEKIEESNAVETKEDDSSNTAETKEDDSSNTTEAREDDLSNTKSTELKPEQNDKSDKVNSDADIKIKEQGEQSMETNEPAKNEAEADATDSNIKNKNEDTSKDTEEKPDDKSNATESTPDTKSDQKIESSNEATDRTAEKMESTDTEPQQATKEETKTQEQNCKQSISDEGGDGDKVQENITDSSERTEQQLLDDLSALTDDNPISEEKEDTATDEKPLESKEQSKDESEDVQTNNEESPKETKNENGDSSEEKPVSDTVNDTGNIEVPDTSQPEKNETENADDKNNSVMDAIDELLQTANEAKESETAEENKEPTSEVAESKETTENDVEMSSSENTLDDKVPEKTEDTADPNDKISTSTDVEMSDTIAHNEPEVSENKLDEPTIDSDSIDVKDTEASNNTRTAESTENEDKPNNECLTDVNEKSQVIDTADEDISKENEALNETENELKTTDKNDSTNKNEPSEDDTEAPVTENAKEHKRKLSTDLTDDISSKKAKLECVRPKGVKKVHKGATFWPSNLRQKLCTCGECISMYKDLKVLFLTDLEDTVFAYESLGKENVAGGASQYEKGLQALSSLDRIQQINALTEYNKMRDKLLDFLKSFKDRKEIVKEEDIKAFFAGMKPRREPDGVYFCR